MGVGLHLPVPSYVIPSVESPCHWIHHLMSQDLGQVESSLYPWGVS